MLEFVKLSNRAGVSSVEIQELNIEILAPVMFEFARSPVLSLIELFPGTRSSWPRTGVALQDVPSKVGIGGFRGNAQVQNPCPWTVEFRNETDSPSGEDARTSSPDGGILDIHTCSGLK